MCEIAEVYGHKLRKARKEHKCCECHGKINKGEQYHYHHGIFDGETCDYKVCLDCELLRAECDKDIKYPEEMTHFEGLVDVVVSIKRELPELFNSLVSIMEKRNSPRFKFFRLDIEPDTRF